MVMKKISVFMLGTISCILFSSLGQKISLISPVQAQDNLVDQAQNMALQVIAKMTEGQRTY